MRFLKLPRHGGWSLNQRHDFMVFLLSFVLACVSPKWTARVGQLIEPFENLIFLEKRIAAALGFPAHFSARRDSRFSRAKTKKNRPRRGGVATHRLCASRDRFFFFQKRNPPGRPTAAKRPPRRSDAIRCKRRNAMRRSALRRRTCAPATSTLWKSLARMTASPRASPRSRPSSRTPKANCSCGRTRSA